MCFLVSCYFASELDVFFVCVLGVFIVQRSSYVHIISVVITIDIMIFSVEILVVILCSLFLWSGGIIILLM